MALVSVQRSPSPDLDVEHGFKTDDNHSPIKRKNHEVLYSRSLSEFYFTVKGAAVILSHPDESNNLHRTCSEDKDLELHLQCMLKLIRQQDTITRVIRLQSVLEDIIRYLAVVENRNEAGTKSVALFGFDLHPEAQAFIGLIVPIIFSSRVKLDGDGGISIETFPDIYFFKPVSIQAMWSVFQYLNKELSMLPGRYVVFENWMNQYKSMITRDDYVRGLWHTSLVDDAMVGDIKAHARIEPPIKQVDSEEQSIKRGLRQIMQSVDLDEVTSRDIREKLEEFLGYPLASHKTLIDKEMLVIMGQLDKPSKIFEYLYLGTEWNASNWEELKANKVGYILNMTKEVDNFYPNQFIYQKIWVSDEATTELLMHWQRTYDFIKKAKSENSVVLVHCKKGISRSSSTVIAYIMKEYGWTLDSALNYVKEKRNCITPNSGFMEQLTMFDGMLQASSNRHSSVFNTHGVSSDVSPPPCQHVDEDLILIKNTQPIVEKIKRVTAISQKSSLITSINFPNMKNRGKIIQLSCLNPFSMTSKLSQEKGDIAYRNTKFCNGKVRQHRDKFEKASTRNTFPPANSQQQQQKDSDEEGKSVRSLVDVFERCNALCPHAQNFEMKTSSDSPMIASVT